MDLNSISRISDLSIKRESINGNKKIGSSFGDYLKNALDKVNELQVEADHNKKMLATGEIENLHQVTIAVEKADIALQFTMSVRNKILDAYNEIMRMQI